MSWPFPIPDLFHNPLKITANRPRINGFAVLRACDNKLLRKHAFCQSRSEYKTYWSTHIKAAPKRRWGKDMKTCVIHIIPISTQPPKNPDTMPSKIPIVMLISISRDPRPGRHAPQKSTGSTHPDPFGRCPANTERSAPLRSFRLIYKDHKAQSRERVSHMKTRGVEPLSEDNAT